MEHGKRWNYALAASLAFNAACIAVVGDAAARRPAPHGHRSAADALHPKPIQMADANQTPTDGSEAHAKSGDGGQGDGDGGSGSVDAGASGHGRGKGKAGDRKSAAHDGSDGADGKADAETLKRLEAIAARTGRLTGAQQRQLARAEARLQAREARLASQEQARDEANPISSGASRERTSMHGGLPLRTASARTGSENPAAAAANRALSTDGPSGVNAPMDQTPPTKMEAGAQSAQAGKDGAANQKLMTVTQPSSPVKNAHGSAGGNSVSPKMIKYGKMKVDLGTIHVTRPKGPVTGGGLSDQRDVEITAHYVIDDLKNQPKDLKPDKFLKLFPPNCNGDPGNKSKCVPTGGNTRLGGGTRHGRHDHITGMKYCVPGSGGLPSAGSPTANSHSSSHGGPHARSGGGKQSSRSANADVKTYGGLHGERAVVTHPYRGPAPESNFQTSYWQNGVENPNEPKALLLHPLHLPAKSSDDKAMTPGGEVPVADRKWVENPMEHTESAPPSEKPSPLARFRVSPRNIGSLSKFGTVNWAPPSKTVRKKQPYGGDGSGLLGLYYKGNNFDQFAFKRPDRNIDFDWSSGPPDRRLPQNQEYTVRWLGKLVPKVTGRYTIMTGSDDGVRLYIDGHLIISNWTVHGPTEDTGAVTLEAGRAYSIKLEYYENGYGLAAMKLYWESAGVPREYIPESCLRYPKAREMQ